MSEEVALSLYVTALLCVWATHTSSAPSPEAVLEPTTYPETIPEPPVSPVSPAKAQSANLTFYVMITLRAW